MKRLRSVKCVLILLSAILLTQCTAFDRSPLGGYADGYHEKSIAFKVVFSEAIELQTPFKDGALEVRRSIKDLESLGEQSEQVAQSAQMENPKEWIYVALVWDHRINPYSYPNIERAVVVQWKREENLFVMLYATQVFTGGHAHMIGTETTKRFVHVIAIPSIYSKLPVKVFRGELWMLPARQFSSTKGR